MELANFDSVRVGSVFPSVFDVRAICGHEQYGIMAKLWTYKSPGEQGYFQFRVKHNEAALFTFRFDDGNVPEEWIDAQVVWDSRDA